MFKATVWDLSVKQYVCYHQLNDVVDPVLGSLLGGVNKREIQHGLLMRCLDFSTPALTSP